MGDYAVACITAILWLAIKQSLSNMMMTKNIRYELLTPFHPCHMCVFIDMDAILCVTVSFITNTNFYY